MKFYLKFVLVYTACIGLLIGALAIKSDLTPNLGSALSFVVGFAGIAAWAQWVEGDEQ